MTPEQCRMARAALKWSLDDLTAKAGVGRATISRFEMGADIREDIRAKIERALTEAGAKFDSRGGRWSVSVPQ
jgi:transcriptional regulator with XRE-family HTH domain